MWDRVPKTFHFNSVNNKNSIMFIGARAEVVVVVDDVCVCVCVGCCFGGRAAREHLALPI